LLILSTLYDMRRTSLSRPGLSLRVLAELTDSSLDEAQFSLWYLRGKKLIETGENDEVAITVTGVDYIEEHGEESEELLALPEARGALKEASDSAELPVPSRARRSRAPSIATCLACACCSSLSEARLR